MKSDVKKRKPSLYEWNVLIMLYILLIGGCAYLGCTRGSEPAYAYPDIKVMRMFHLVGHNKYTKEVMVDDNTTYSGLYVHNTHNTKPDRFINNIYSHPITHGTISLVHGNGFDPTYDEANKYNHKLVKPKALNSPEESASFVSKKGIPINRMMAHRKQLDNSVKQNAQHILSNDLRNNNKAQKGR